MARSPRAGGRKSGDQPGRHLEAQERSHSQAGRVSAASGVAGMIPPAVHQRFAAVLKAEQLAEIPTSFCDPAFYDEVPLYSRYEQIDFLHEYGDVDRLLMGL